MKEERSVFRTVWTVFTIDVQYMMVVGPVINCDTDIEAWGLVNATVSGTADRSQPQYVCFMQSVAFTNKAGDKNITCVIKRIVEDKL